MRVNKTRADIIKKNYKKYRSKESFIRFLGILWVLVTNALQMSIGDYNR